MYDWQNTITAQGLMICPSHDTCSVSMIVKNIVFTYEFDTQKVIDMIYIQNKLFNKGDLIHEAWVIKAMTTLMKHKIRMN